jgi:hypothetical protein
MPVEKVRKYLDKMLEEDGVCGYAVDGDRIVVFVEDQRAADKFVHVKFEGYTVDFQVTGRFEFLGLKRDGQDG